MEVSEIVSTKDDGKACSSKGSGSVSRRVIINAQLTFNLLA